MKLKINYLSVAAFFDTYPGMTDTVVVVVVADLMVGEAWDLAAEVVETTGDTNPLVVVEVEVDGEVREEVATATRMHRHTTITKVGGEKCGLWHCCLQIQTFIVFMYLVYVGS